MRSLILILLASLVTSSLSAPSKKRLFNNLSLSSIGARRVKREKENAHALTSEVKSLESALEDLNAAANSIEAFRETEISRKDMTLKEKEDLGTPQMSNNHLDITSTNLQPGEESELDKNTANEKLNEFMMNSATFAEDMNAVYEQLYARQQKLLTDMKQFQTALSNSISLLEGNISTETHT